MKKFLAGSLVLFAGAVPIVPQPLQLLYSYQTTPQAVLADAVKEQTVSSSTAPSNVTPPFTDEDGNGKISVAVFQDASGKQSFVKIPDAKYDAMGKKEGQLQNPTDTDYKSALEILVPQAHAAIARDASSTASGIPNATSVTWSHTISGANTILVVFGYIEDGCTITSGTFNGTGITQVASQGPTSTRLAYSYYQIAPTSGAHNIVLNASTTCHLTGEAISYTGAKQVSQPDANNQTSTNNTTNSLSVNVTTVAANAWIAGFMVDDNGWGATFNNITATGAFSKVLAGGWNGTGSFDTNGVVASPASTAVGWSNSNTSGVLSDRFLMAVSIAPAVAVASFKPWQLFEF